MMLSLLLALAAPSPDTLPEPPRPCQVHWGAAISPRFIEGTEQRIARRCRELVDALDHPAEPDSIRVEVGGETYAFTVRVDLLDHGEVVYAQPADDQVCTCSSNDLSAFAMKRIATAIATHRTPPPTVSVAEPQDPPAPVATPQPVPHTLRWAGVAVGAVGAATLLTGALLRPRTRTDRVSGEGTHRVRTQPAFAPRTTAALLAIGASAVGIGVGLIVGDVLRERQARRSVGLMPVWGPEGGGAVVRVGF